MRTVQSPHRKHARDITSNKQFLRSAVGYIRVSSGMQAIDGLSLDAQTSAIEQCCASQGLRLLEINKDVLSGGKAERPGLAGCAARSAARRGCSRCAKVRSAE